MTEAGWYPDPEGRDSLRYWDGSAWTGHWSEKPRSPVDEAHPTGSLDKPAPRIIRTPHEAEELAAEWCRWYGYEDVETTGHSSDGGVDVRARRMVAQVKMLSVPVGRPDLQQLYGVAMAQRAVPLFFSVGNYSREASQWAEQVGMALFGYTRAGEVEAVNSFAVAIENRAEGQLAKPKEPWWALPLGCDDATACSRIMPEQGRFRRQTDQILWIRQGWLPVATVRYDYTYVSMVSGRGERFVNRQLQQRVPYIPARSPRTEELFAQSSAAVEMVKGYAVGVPPSQAKMTQLPAEQVNLRPREGIDRLIEMIYDAYHSYSRPPHQGHHALTRYNLPGNARTLRVIETGKFVVPIFAALIAGPAGNRITVVEGVTGSLDPHLSSHLTRHAPDLLDEIYAGRQVGPT